MNRIASCSKLARNIPGSFIGKVPFVGEILAPGKCGFYKTIECFGNKGIGQFTASLLDLCSARALFSFRKEFIAIKNGALLPDMSR